MFTAQFKEQTADEIPLPGKKALEIKELLQVIYPSIGKTVREANYLFLLNLAKEYMMTKLTKMCESFLIGKLIYGHFVPWSDRSESDRSKQLSDRSIK